MAAYIRVTTSRVLAVNDAVVVTGVSSEVMFDVVGSAPRERHDGRSSRVPFAERFTANQPRDQQNPAQKGGHRDPERQQPVPRADSGFEEKQQLVGNHQQELPDRDRATP